MGEETNYTVHLTLNVSCIVTYQKFVNSVQVPGAQIGICQMRFGAVGNANAMQMQMQNYITAAGENQGC